MKIQNPPNTDTRPGGSVKPKNQLYIVSTLTPEQFAQIKADFLAGKCARTA